MRATTVLVCVVINNSNYLPVKHNNTAYHALGKYSMQARISAGLTITQ